MKISIFLSLVFLIGCNSTKKFLTGDLGQDLGVEKHQLSRTQAERRFAQISDVDYNLTFHLSQKETYAGSSQINFNVKNTSGDLRVDFHDGDVTKVLLNNQEIPLNYNKVYLRIPKEHLIKGANQLTIDFTRKFSTNGNGFHRFVDPEDQRIYTYTNLEPYAANQVFPCFDQPDLKATYKMTVNAPSRWKVITSVYADKVERNKGNKTWYFPQSQRFSTYIWSLHAGEYYMWKDESGSVPLRLFARQSLAKNVKVQDWFPVTQQGLKFFNEYFDYPYPYKKYDQVIVPEFNFGAMENVGAVTFRESFVHRGQKSRKNRRDLANVIMHEMAHMWFGNLVTMKWWNDLWLNESFANYMAFLASYKATEFKEAWIDFHSDKAWAYWEDQLPTTHPIEAVVPNTQQAFANFDGITYGKGASSLKQLSFLIGDINFRNGLRKYFKKHAGGNTLLKDFIAALQSTTSVNLKAWQKEWLQTSSVNIVESKIKCEHGKIKDLTIHQSALPGFSKLRSHKTKIAFFKKENESLKLSNTLKTTIKGDETELEDTKGFICPDLIFPNYEDYAYLKAHFDKDSLVTLQKQIGSVEDVFLRELLWRSTWDMVRDGKFNIVNYTQMLVSHLEKENDPTILRFLTRRTLNSSLSYLPQESELQKKFFSDATTSLENIVWNKLRKAPAGSELQKALYTAFVSTASSTTALNQLKKLLDGKIRLTKLTIDQDKRWGILIKLSAKKFPRVQSLIKKEARRDKSDNGKTRLMIAQAIYPDYENKIQWVKDLKDKDKKISYDKFRMISRNLFPWYQEELQKKYRERFYSDLKQVESQREVHFAKEFAKVAPRECQMGQEGQILNFLKSHPNLRPSTSKSLKMIDHESSRCRKIRELAKSSKAM